MKKIKALVILITLLLAMSPGMVMARGLVPEGVTLQGWSTTANNGGKSSTINLLYTDGFSMAIPLSTPFDSSWYSVNDVRGFIQAYKEGYGPDLGGEGGVLGTDINFAPNVLAAMKAQNFNPAQVGGANIPPESTTLNEEQIAWLKQIGYTAPVETPPVVKNDPPPEPAKAQPAPKEETQTPKPVESKPVIASAPKADPADPVGETVETPAIPMTQEMVEESQKLAAVNPPTVNEPIVPVTEQTAEAEEQISNWIIPAGVAVGIAILITIVIVYIKQRRR